MQSIRRHLVWLVIAVFGAFALGTVALSRGETINAIWVVAAAICTYLIAYRYYNPYFRYPVSDWQGISEVRGDLTQLPGLLVARCLASEALLAGVLFSRASEAHFIELDQQLLDGKR